MEYLTFTFECDPWVELGRQQKILFEPSTFPEGLKSLIIGRCKVELTDPLSNFNYPSSLEHLRIDLSNLDQQSFPNYIPSTLKTATLANPRHSFGGTLQLSLTHLTIEDCFYKEFQFGDLHHGLRTLKLAGMSAYTLHLTPGVFPSSLRRLVLSSLCGNKLDPNILPEGLLEFDLNHGDIEFEICSLPASLQVLGLPGWFERSLSTMSDVFATLPNLSKPCFSIFIRLAISQ